MLVGGSYVVLEFLQTDNAETRPLLFAVRHQSLDDTTPDAVYYARQAEKLVV